MRGKRLHSSVRNIIHGFFKQSISPKCIHSLELLKDYPWRSFMNIDETHNGGHSKHQARRARTKKGKRAFRKDWIINNVRFSIIAVYTPAGFLCWKFYYANVTHLHFIDFLENSVKKYILPENVMLFDNASVHTEVSALRKMNEITNGNHKRVPPYACRLSPVERGFSQVWSYVRKNGKEAMVYPERVINRSFELYSINGAKGYKGKFICCSFNHIFSYFIYMTVYIHVYIFLLSITFFLFSLYYVS
jgi:hypothetical protein